MRAQSREIGILDGTRLSGLEFQSAIRLLVEAFKSAQAVDVDAWCFALEIDFLHAAGLGNSDIRWLVAKEYIEHREEITNPGCVTRSFRPTASLAFHERSCFVVEESTVDWIRKLLPDQKPRWNPQRGQLSVGNQLVKQVKFPSPVQESLLNAFDEEGWPEHIDDPLPPQSGQDSKVRLRNAIKTLNRNQQDQLIRFRGDGTGEGIVWELLHDCTPSDSLDKSSHSSKRRSPSETQITAVGGSSKSGRSNG